MIIDPLFWGEQLPTLHVCIMQIEMAHSDEHALLFLLSKSKLQWTIKSKNKKNINITGYIL